jgi:hypothetical protein
MFNIPTLNCFGFRLWLGRDQEWAWLETEGSYLRMPELSIIRQEEKVH